VSISFPAVGPGVQAQEIPRAGRRRCIDHAGQASGQPDAVNLDLVTLYRAVVLDRRFAKEENIPFDMILRDSQPLVHVG
jgi:hypothetical protein